MALSRVLSARSLAILKHKTNQFTSGAYISICGTRDYRQFSRSDYNRNRGYHNSKSLGKHLNSINISRQVSTIMNAVDFYYMPESPPCRAVEMVANMVGVNLSKHYINLFTGDQMKDDYVKMNPLHKVPFIVDGNLKLGESRAIMAYLVSRYKSGDPLYPNDPVQRAGIDEMLFYEAATLYPSGSKLFRPILFGGKKELDPESDKAYQENLDYLDKRLANNGESKFLFGDHLTIADISLCAHFSFTLSFDYDLSKYSRIVAYIDRMKAAIPDYSKINHEAEANMKKFIKSKLEA